MTDEPKPELPKPTVDASLVFVAGHVPIGIEEQDIDVVRMYVFGHTTREIAEATGLSPAWCAALRKKYRHLMADFERKKDDAMRVMVEQGIVEAARLGSKSLQKMVKDGEKQRAGDLKAIGDFMGKMMEVREKLGGGGGGKGAVPQRQLTDEEEARMVADLPKVGEDDAG